MNCPNCGEALRARDRSGVRIDFCPACRGVWLDRGELDKVIALELEDDGRGIEAQNAENARDARARDEGGSAGRSKKSSFFGSLTEMLGGEE